MRAVGPLVDPDLQPGGPRLGARLDRRRELAPPARCRRPRATGTIGAPCVAPNISPRAQVAPAGAFGQAALSPSRPGWAWCDRPLCRQRRPVVGASGRRRAPAWRARRGPAASKRSGCQRPVEQSEVDRAVVGRGTRQPDGEHGGGEVALGRRRAGRRRRAGGGCGRAGRPAGRSPGAAGRLGIRSCSFVVPARGGRRRGQFVRAFRGSPRRRAGSGRPAWPCGGRGRRGARAGWPCRRRCRSGSRCRARGRGASRPGRGRASPSPGIAVSTPASARSARISFHIATARAVTSFSSVGSTGARSRRRSARCSAHSAGSSSGRRPKPRERRPCRSGVHGRARLALGRLGAALSGGGGGVEGWSGCGHGGGSGRLAYIESVADLELNPNQEWRPLPGRTAVQAQRLSHGAAGRDGRAAVEPAIPAGSCVGRGLDDGQALGGRA